MENMDLVAKIIVLTLKGLEDKDRNALLDVLFELEYPTQPA